MHHHPLTLKDGASPEAIAALESRYGFSMPDEVRQFYLRSDGCIVNDRYVVKNRETIELVSYLYSLHLMEYAIQRIRRFEEDLHYYFSDVLLPIGDCEAGRDLCVGIGGPYYGKIYIIDYQYYEFDENYDEMLFYLADSLEELFGMLKPEYQGWDQYGLNLKTGAGLGAVESLEKLHGFNMPDELKDFYLTSDGCTITKQYMVKNGRNIASVAALLTLDQISEAIQRIRRFEKEEHYRFSDVLLPIGICGDGKDLCMGVGNTYTGKVYIIDESAYKQDGDYNAMLFLCSDSLEALFGALRKYQAWEGYPITLRNGANAGAIKALEEAYGFTMPEEATNFYLKSDGCAIIDQDVMKNAETIATVDDIYSLGAMEQAIRRARLFEEKAHYRFSDVLLPIGVCDDGKDLCVGVSKSYTGKIYKIDHNAYRQDEDYDVMLLTLADSLEDLFGSLRPYRGWLQYGLKLKARANPEMIEALEERFDFVMPDDIKSFYLKSNGCTVTRPYIVKNGRTLGTVNSLYSLQQMERAIQRSRHFEAENHYCFADVLLPIGDCGTGKDLRVGVTKPYAGKIYMINCQSYNGDGNYEAMLSVLADSLEGLFGMLRSEYQVWDQYPITLKPGASTEAIDSLIKEWGFALPDEIHEFYLISDGCQVTDQYVVKNGKTASVVSRLYALPEIREAIRRNRRFETEKHYCFTDVLLPIGDCGYNMDLCVGFDKAYTGKIYKIDYLAYKGDNNYEAMLLPLAGSLRGLFEGLRPTPQEWGQYPITLHAEGATAKAIETMEQGYGFVMPDEAKQFYLTSNGCQVKDRYIWKNGKAVAVVGGLYTLSEMRDAIQRNYRFEAEKHYCFSDTLLPIGDCDADRYLCMGIGKFYSGKIYIVDYAAYEEGGNYEAMLFHLADSLVAFFGMLRAES